MRAGMVGGEDLTLANRESNGGKPGMDAWTIAAWDNCGMVPVVGAGVGDLDGG